MSDTRSISAIAREVESDWQEKVNFAARPYLDAMHTLTSVNDSFYADSAHSVIAYFLANASTWRGDTARRVKAELNKMIK
tara:strand:+ start:937 stop:1176 length:240 start_codon:yes stop_codon:yes gene_type:complete